MHLSIRGHQIGLVEGSSIQPFRNNIGYLLKGIFMGNFKTLAVIGLLLASFMAVGQTGDGHSHQHNSAPDNRVVADFPPSMQQHILANMRDHLLAISQIQEAIGKAEYDKAADIAETRLGQTALKTHGAYENSKYMPKGMQDIGSTMHRNASKFAIEIQNSSATGDIKPAMIALSKTTQACVACHAGYKLK